MAMRGPLQRKRSLHRPFRAWHCLRTTSQACGLGYRISAPAGLTSRGFNGAPSTSASEGVPDFLAGASGSCKGAAYHAGPENISGILVDKGLHVPTGMYKLTYSSRGSVRFSVFSFQREPP